MTEKQEMFIRNLMAQREMGDLYNSVEAQTVRAGMADRIPARQASEFIEALLECPMKVREQYVPQPKASKTLAKKLKAEAAPVMDRLTDEQRETLSVLCGITREGYENWQKIINAVK